MTKAFIGAIYIILNLFKFIVPVFSSLYFEIKRNIVNKAIFVLPLEVGAQINKFSSVYNAVCNTLD